MNEPNNQAEIPTAEAKAAELAEKVAHELFPFQGKTHYRELRKQTVEIILRELNLVELVKSKEEGQHLRQLNAALAVGRSVFEDKCAQLLARVAELEKAGGRLVMELENLRTDSGYSGNSEGMDLYHTAIDNAMKPT